MKVKDILSKPTLDVPALAKKHGRSQADIEQQLKQGIKVELEHTDSVSVAREIALDHLGEDPEYYSQLTQAGLE